MEETAVLPELKEILGAMIFGASRPLSPKEMTKCLVEVAEKVGAETAAFKGVREQDVIAALNELEREIRESKAGFELVQVAGGYRFQSCPACGRWVRHLLNVQSRNRLSQPALETLAIIAYRQPLTRAEIEAIRGVNVDHVMKTLLEMQLVRICGRSELPGRPFLYGTTQAFLEHFGLKDLKDLAGIDPSLFKQMEKSRGSKGEEHANPESEKHVVDAGVSSDPVGESYAPVETDDDVTDADLEEEDEFDDEEDEEADEEEESDEEDEPDAGEENTESDERTS